MKDLNLLIWLSQLGLSVALPLGGCIGLAVWLHESQSWGGWVLIVGILLGVFLAIDGLRLSLKTMAQHEKNTRKKKEEPPVSFNEHQ